MRSHEKKQQTAEDLIQVCRRLYQAIDQLDTRAASIAGVTRNDLRCLNLLADGPAKPNHIAKSLGLTTGSVTSLLDRMEKINLVERQRDPNDRRGIIVHPTKHLFSTLGPLYRSTALELQTRAESYSQRELDDAIRYLSDAVSAYEKSTETTP